MTHIPRFQLALLPLVVLILSDAFLKQYVFASLQDALFFSFVKITVVGLLLLSGGMLFLQFRRDEAGSQIWERLLEVSAPSRLDRIAAIAIIAAGTVFRFWNLDTLYDGVWYDEAYKGLDAIAVHALGERPVFLNWNGPREPMVAYLVAAFCRVLGDSVLSVRAVEALAGSLTLVFFYLFVQKLFHPRVALGALFFLAFSKYHLIFSRMGFRVNLFPLFEVAALYFLARAFLTNRGRLFSFVLAGLTAGLGFYTYISYRIFPLILLAFLLDPLIRKKLRENVRGLAFGGIVCLAAAGPLAVYFWKNPGDFTARMESVSIWNEGDVSVPDTLLQNVTTNASMFTFRGDPRVRQNVRREPALSPWITAFFLIGLLLSVSQIRRSRAMFLMLYLLVSLLPGIFSIHGPHFARNLGALPPAMILCALGVMAAGQLAVPPALRRGFAILILGGVLITGWMDAMIRYPFYVDRPERLASGMNWLETNVAREIGSLGTACRPYLTPQLFYHATVEYLTYPELPQELFTMETIPDREKVSVIFLLTGERDLWWLKDNDRMDYFKWWREYHGTDTGSIRHVVNRTYGLSDSNTKYSDRHLLEELRRRYPAGKEMRLGPGTVFFVPRS